MRVWRMRTGITISITRSDRNRLEPDFLHTNILAKPDYELKTFINSGRGIMPSFQGVLKDREIEDVISYIRTFN